MKVSARNMLGGTVHGLRRGEVSTEVEVILDGGERLVAVSSTEARESLGLAPGNPVVAIFKAPWVMVMNRSEAANLSARNQLHGTVRSVEQGQVNAEVVIELPSGAQIASVVTREAVIELGLAPGVAASALIKASHIVLGAPR